MTIFDHLRQCAANGDTPTLNAEDAARIVRTMDALIEMLDEPQRQWAKSFVFETTL